MEKPFFTNRHYNTTVPAEKKTITGLVFLKEYQVIEKGKKCCGIWQTGGGFDRNLWNPEAIHQSIE